MLVCRCGGLIIVIAETTGQRYCKEGFLLLGSSFAAGAGGGAGDGAL